MEARQETTRLLKELFSRLYKNCEPLAFQLDGFTHAVYFIDFNEMKVKKEECSNYMSVSETQFYKTFTDRCKLLFNGYPNYSYQNNAQELIVHKPEEIETLMNNYKLNNIININNNMEVLRA